MKPVFYEHTPNKTSKKNRIDRSDHHTRNMFKNAVSKRHLNVKKAERQYKNDNFGKNFHYDEVDFTDPDAHYERAVLDGNYSPPTNTMIQSTYNRYDGKGYLKPAIYSEAIIDPKVHSAPKYIDGMNHGLVQKLPPVLTDIFNKCQTPMSDNLGVRSSPSFMTHMNLSK